LAENTLYHYRVHSADTLGHEVTSSDFIFTTASGGLLLADDFNASALDTDKWARGSNSGNQTAVIGGALWLRSQGAQSGWVMTRQAYVARNTTVTVKVVQPSDDGDLGMSPTYTLSSTNGIHGEPTWYRFYTYRASATGPYLLFVQWKKNGTISGLDVTGELVIEGTVYLRLRMDDSEIHFEASLDSVNWIDTYHEPFSLTGYSLDNVFHYELSGYRTAERGELVVDDFAIWSSSSSSRLARRAEMPKIAQEVVPRQFFLSPGYPNPFNLATRIILDLPENGRVQAVVFNLGGQEVARLHGEYFAAGSHMLRWPGTNAEGLAMGSGIYLLRVIFEADSGKREHSTRRLVLIK
jgi:hypothetical protein